MTAFSAPALTLITGGSDLPESLLPALQAAPGPDPLGAGRPLLDNALDAIYGFAQHMEGQLEAAVRLAAAVRRDHDQHHPDPFATCGHEPCRTAADILP